MYEDKFPHQTARWFLYLEEIIWFSESISQGIGRFCVEEKTVHHKLTHKILKSVF